MTALARRCPTPSLPLLGLLAIAVSLSAPACDDSSGSPDEDASTGEDGSQNIGQDTRPVDAPAMNPSDAPRLDAVLDAPVSPDAPMIVDAPVSPDAPMTPDAPIPSDASNAAVPDAPAATIQLKGFAQGFGEVEAITRGPDNILWFIGTGGKIGHLIAENNIPTFTIDAAVVAGTTGRNRIVKGPDGNLWFTIEKMRRFGHITPAGTITADNQFLAVTPDDITTGPDGNLWVAGTGEGAVRITPAGTMTKFPCGATNTILSGPDGNLWYVDNIPNVGIRGIGRITTAGVVTQFAVLPADRECTVHGLALSNGQLWTIGIRPLEGMLPPDQIANLSFTRRLSITGAFAGPPQVLHGYRMFGDATSGTSTAVGPDGSVWYYEARLVIGRVYPNGSVRRFDIPAPGTTNRFSKMAFDANGNLWLPMRDGLLRVTVAD